MYKSLFCWIVFFSVYGVILGLGLGYFLGTTMFPIYFNYFRLSH